MNSFVGEYSCKLDAKGRILLPAGLLRQMDTSGEEIRLIAKKNIYEPCIDLYPEQVWENLMSQMRKSINPFDPQHAKFMRGFLGGTAEIILDSNNRILFPKLLMDKANISKDVVLLANAIENKVEVWDKELYESHNQSDEDFASLATEILGSNFNMGE